MPDTDDANGQDHYAVDAYRSYSILYGNGGYYWTGSTTLFQTVQQVRDNIDAKIAITISAHFE